MIEFTRKVNLTLIHKIIFLKHDDLGLNCKFNNCWMAQERKRERSGVMKDYCSLSVLPQYYSFVSQICLVGAK